MSTYINIYLYIRMPYMSTYRNEQQFASIPYYRMCSLTVECVLLLWNVFSYYRNEQQFASIPYYRMCSLTVECVLLLQERAAVCFNSRAALFIGSFVHQVECVLLL